MEKVLFCPKLSYTRFLLQKTSDFNQDFANAIAQMFIHYHQLRDPLVGMGKCFIHDIFLGACGDGSMELAGSPTIRCKSWCAE